MSGDDGCTERARHARVGHQLLHRVGETLGDAVNKQMESQCAWLLSSVNDAAPYGDIGQVAAPSAETDPVTVLRGAKVDVDPRRTRIAIAIVLLAALGSVAVTLLVAAFEKNAQINELRFHGVQVEMTVTRCLGLLGGSGSNAAGYACRGTYTFGRRRFEKAIPGDLLRAPGSKIVAVIVPTDPALVSTEAAVRAERASADVFIVPAISLVLFVLASGLLVLRTGLGRRSTSLSPG